MKIEAFLGSMLLVFIITMGVNGPASADMKVLADGEMENSFAAYAGFFSKNDENQFHADNLLSTSDFYSFDFGMLDGMDEMSRTERLNFGDTTVGSVQSLVPMEVTSIGEGAIDISTNNATSLISSYSHDAIRLESDQGVGSGPSFGSIHMSDISVQSSSTLIISTH